jgi:hypothetical protein
VKDLICRPDFSLSHSIPRNPRPKTTAASSHQQLQRFDDADTYLLNASSSFSNSSKSPFSRLTSFGRNTSSERTTDSQAVVFDEEVDDDDVIWCSFVERKRGTPLRCFRRRHNTIWDE